MKRIRMLVTEVPTHSSSERLPLLISQESSWSYSRETYYYGKTADAWPPLSNKTIYQRTRMPPATKRSNLPALIGAIGAALTTGGPTYAFGLYGAALKKSLGLSQSDLDTISTFFFVAGLCSWAPGLFTDRFGPRLAIAIGSCSGCASLMLYWCIAKEYIIIETHWLLVGLLSVLGFATFLSSAMVTGSVFKVLTLTAGPAKGQAVGVAKGLVGLGSGAYTCMFEAMKTTTQSDLDFLPLAAVLFITCATLPAILFIPSQKDLLQAKELYYHDAQSWHFRMLYAALLGMGMLIVSDSLVALWQDGAESDDDKALRQDGKSSWITFVLLFLWWGPLLVIWAFQPKHDETPTAYLSVQSRDEDDDNEVNAPPPVSSASEPDATETSEDTERFLANITFLATTAAIETADRNLWQMLQTSEAACLGWTVTILVGAGTVETNNMGQMVEALGLTAAVIPASMALFSVAQAGARVVTGALSEVTLQAYQWPRPIFLVFASAIGVGAHLLLGLATSEVGFVAGVTVAGLAFGMVWPLMVLCIGEIFGPSSFGANYMFYDGFSSAMGTLLLSKMIAQDVYEHHIDETTAPDAFTCIGTDCFRSTHYVIALLSLTCVGSSLAFMQLTRNVYKALPTTTVLSEIPTDDEEDAESAEEFLAPEERFQ
jgi:MFS family permease